MISRIQACNDVLYNCLRHRSAWGFGLLCLSPRCPVLVETMGGPGPLRGEAAPDIFGLPTLSSANRRKVDLSNNYIRFAVKVCDLGIRTGLQTYLESSLTSRLWKIPAIRALTFRQAVSQTRFDCCRYGTPWRKATRILHVYSPDFGANALSCNGGNGRCVDTGKYHIQLAGTDSNGIHWIKRAEKHPILLCSQWAASIRDSAVTLWLAAHWRMTEHNGCGIG